MGVIAFIIAAIFIYFLVVEFWLDILLLAIIIGTILVIVTIITKKVQKKRNSNISYLKRINFTKKKQKRKERD